LGLVLVQGPLCILMALSLISLANISEHSSTIFLMAMKRELRRRTCMFNGSCPRYRADSTLCSQPEKWQNCTMRILLEELEDGETRRDQDLYAHSEKGLS
jgi:hypothetical protein